MSDIDDARGPWFVATDLDEPDGWYFTPPDHVADALRALPIDWLAVLWDGSIDDESLTAITDRIIAAFEDPWWVVSPSGRGDAALLATLFEEADAAVLRRIRRTRRGGFRLRFGVVDRMVLTRALDRLDSLLGSDDPSLARLFPNPYPDDVARAEGWKAMVTDELIEKRREGLATVRRMVSQSSATEDEVLQLMRTVNDTRLMLGTFLDVSEDEPLRLSADDPDVFLAQAYEYLGFLLSSILRALN